MKIRDETAVRKKPISFIVMKRLITKPRRLLISFEMGRMADTLNILCSQFICLEIENQALSLVSI